MAFTFDEFEASQVVQEGGDTSPVPVAEPSDGFTFDDFESSAEAPPPKRVRGAHGKQRLLDYEAEIYNQLGGSEQVDFKSTPTWNHFKVQATLPQRRC